MEQYIDAGALNRRVTIQRFDGTKDAYGDEDESGWVDVCTVWAAVNAVGDRQFWEAQAAHGELTHKVTIRYRRDIGAEMRLLLGSRKLDIIGPPVDYDERHKYLVLRCREVTT